MRSEAAVALRIGHGAVGHEVALLEVLDVLPEALVVLGAPGLVGLVGHGVQRVDGVHAHAALEARARLLAQQALHLDLLREVVGGLMDMRKAVDLGAGEMAHGEHEVFVLGVARELVRRRDAVDAGADHRMVDVVVDLLAEEIDLQVQVGKALNELLGGSESHVRATPSWRPVHGAGLPGAGAGSQTGALARSLRCGGGRQVGLGGPGALSVGL